MTRRTTAVLLTAASVAFLVCVLAANYVTTRYGLVWIPFGLEATAGTYFAGATFVLRDSIQDWSRRLLPPELAAGNAAPAMLVLGLILVGGALSFALSAPEIAIASLVAFTLSEILDLGIYTPLRSRGYLRAAVASNVVGTVADTVLFLAIAGFGLTAGVVTGQIVGKLTVTAAVVATVAVCRLIRRRRRGSVSVTITADARQLEESLADARRRIPSRDDRKGRTR